MAPPRHIFWFHHCISISLNVDNVFEFLWKSKVLPSVLAFRWLVLWGNILTFDNLCWCKVLVVNACPFCLLAEESMDHLLLHCAMAEAIWNSLLSCFNYTWVLPLSIHDLFQYWKLPMVCFNFCDYLGHLEGKEREMFWRKILLHCFCYLQIKITCSLLGFNSFGFLGSAYRCRYL